MQQLEAFGSSFIPKVHVLNIIHLTSDGVQAHEQVREITFGLVLCSPMLPRMGCGERSPRLTLCPSWRVLVACGLTPAGTGCSTATLEGFSTPSPCSGLHKQALSLPFLLRASQTGPFTTIPAQGFTNRHFHYHGTIILHPTIISTNANCIFARFEFASLISGKPC